MCILGTGNETTFPIMLDLQVSKDRSTFIMFNNFLNLFFVNAFMIIIRGSGWEGCKCQLKVKILSICQLSVKCQLIISLRP